MDARRFLSEGDLISARSNVDKARSLRSRVKRQIAFSNELSNDSWRQKLGFDDISSLEYSEIVKLVNTEWQQIGQWYTSVIRSIGIDELLCSEGGTDLLLDFLLPEVWDFKVDITIIAAKHEQYYLGPLLRRGQSVIIIVDEISDDPVVKSGPTIHQENETAILYLLENESLNADHFSAIDRGQSPTIAYISHEDRVLSAETLSGLNSSILKEFISKKKSCQMAGNFYRATSSEFTSNCRFAIRLRSHASISRTPRNGSLSRSFITEISSKNKAVPRALCSSGTGQIIGCIA